MSWPVTPEFESALKSEGRIVIIRVDILEAGVRVASSDVAVVSGTDPDLSLAGGGATSNRLQAVRRNGSCSLQDTSGVLADLRSNDLLDPRAGREFRLWRGLRLLDQATLTTRDELVPIGTFEITRATMVETAESVAISLAGDDRSQTLAAAAWPDIAVIEEGWTIAEAAQFILDERLPHLGLIANVAATAVVLPEIILDPDQGDPNLDLRKIAEAAGFDAYFDVMGVPDLKPWPNPEVDTPVWRYLNDSERIIVGPVTRNIDRRTLRNGVVVESSAPWLVFPVRGEAWDTDPTSPTYYDPADPSASRVGPHPHTIKDAYITDEAQAEEVAIAKLPEVLGIEETFEFSAIVHPGLEAGDVIEVETNSAGRVKASLESSNVPLGVTELQGGTQRRRRR